MQKKVPRMVPCAVGMRVQLVYSKLCPGASSGCLPTTARPRTSSVWPWASVITQCRATSCAATSPLFTMVIVYAKACCPSWDCSGRYWSLTVQRNSGFAIAGILGAPGHEGGGQE